MEEKNAHGRGRAGRHHGTHRAAAAEFTGALPIRLILVPVDESSAGRIRLDIATHLARANDADLVGVELIGSSKPASITGHIDGEHTPLHQMFSSKMAAVGIGYHWRETSADGQDDIIAWSKLADLTVLSRLAEDTPPLFHAERIGLECGRPILLLPPERPTETIGLNVVVAWDASREAVRALHDAIPLMRDAARVAIVECRADLSRRHHPDGAAATAILERHGVQAFSEIRTIGPESVTDALLDCIRDNGADLLVAGLYHHARFHEYIFGGVSRELLRHCPVPLFVSH